VVSLNLAHPVEVHAPGEHYSEELSG